ncbi:VOC family protein [Halalkalibacillus halophilus]|uniref:VOC family protein n=1 Tax=Halalkalibacillus halophilus TaxID=392827 RepID=UPI0003F747E2|nr:VOC family protein [Halalkalibacillus halophilus]
MNFHQLTTTHVSHVNLKVKDLKRSLNFYHELFGMTVVEKEKGKAVLSFGEQPASLTLLEVDHPTPLQNGHTGLFHMALLLPTREALANVLTFFITHNHQIQGASDHGVSEALYLADPDGNGIEIYRDRSFDSWSWKKDQVEMVSEPLDVDGLLKEANEDSFEGLPPETIIGHIHLKANRLQESRKFYVEGIGLKEVASYGDQALFLSDQNYHHHVALNTWFTANGRRQENNEIGLQSYTLNISEDMKESIVNQLSVLGYEIKDDKEGNYQVEDPNGIWVLF